MERNNNVGVALSFPQENVGCKHYSKNSCYGENHVIEAGKQEEFRSSMGMRLERSGVAGLFVGVGVSNYITVGQHMAVDK